MSELKSNITKKFNKSKFNLDNCGTAENGLWEGVDEYIREFIRNLNASPDIITLYSCEGHHKDDTAYIFFNVNEKGWDIFWQQVMPEISEKFCTNHPENTFALYQREWLVSTKHNEYNSGISIHTTLVDFVIQETGRIMVSWEEKKRFFWDVIQTTFKKYYL